MKSGKNRKETAVDILFDILGSIAFAIGICTFAQNGHFAPGGVSGLALIFNHLWNMPIGAMTLVINIPIIALSYKLLGRQFLLKSFRTMLISSFFIDVVFARLPAYSGNQLLSSVFAGFFLGLGLALIYMRGSSTGGSDFLNVSLKKLLPHLSMGKINLITDSVIIFLGGLVFGNIDAVLYGILCTYVTSLIIDRVLDGAGAGKLALIITDKGLDTARKISDTVGRGSTMIRAVGTYSQEERQLILCACSNSEITKIRRLSCQEDPSAFVMIAETNEVYGQGFKSPGEKL